MVANSTTAKTSPKKSRVSRSTRAGIIFPVTRVHRLLKSIPTATNRVTRAAAIYLASVIEYLVAELLELGGNVARDYNRRRVIPRYLLFAIANDEELHKLLSDVVIPEAGVVPSINSMLIAKAATLIPKTPSLPTTTTTATTTKNVKKATPTKKPALKKNSTGSFTKFGDPKSQAAALKGSSVTLLSERVLIRGQKLSVVQGSIVNIKADAFVHPTNNSLYMGGDVGNALAKAGGKKLRDIVSQSAAGANLSNPGDVAITDAADLAASHLIHVNSPTWNAANSAECIADLDKATINILTLADNKGLNSVALPSISSGHAGFPKQTAAQTILAALSKYFRQTATTKLQQVFFVLYDPESVNVYTTELQRMVE